MSEPVDVVEATIPSCAQEELAIREEGSKVAFEKLQSAFPAGLVRDVPDQEVKEHAGI